MKAKVLRFPTAEAAPQEHLYHGTPSTTLADIFGRRPAGEIDAPSYWGTARMAEAYARDMCTELGGHPCIIKVPMSLFDLGGLEVDGDAASDPKCHVIGRSARELAAEFAGTPKTWRDCLRTYESVEYGLPIEVERAWLERRDR